MKTRIAIIGLTSVIVLTGGAYGIYQRGVQQGMVMNTAPATTATATLDDPSQWSFAQGQAATERHIKSGIKAGDIDPKTGLKVLHYYDPMMPASKFEAPGKSPMDMMMIPAYAGSKAEADTGTVAISARRQQNTGIRTTTVIEGSLAPQVNATGTISWNERDQVVLQARAQGFIEKLYVRAIGDRVVKGQPLAELHVPEWVAVEEEFIALTHMQGNDLASLLTAAKDRMRQAGMDEEQIQQVVTSGKVQSLITLRASIAGVVTELAAREGMTMMPGTTLFRLNGTATVWADAEVPESQAALLHVGDHVTAATPSVLGTHFEGQIQSLLPAISPELRTRKARLQLTNSTGLLVPGMLMQMTFNAATQTSVLLVPTEAIINTGKRTVVMLTESEGKFRPVEVETGIESGGQTEIKSGLQAGQKVVLSGQFLLDSEASLRGLEARLDPDAAATTGAAR